jgi:WD40 repeat protein
MAFSRDGQLLVTGEDAVRELQIWAVDPAGILTRVGTVADDHVYGPDSLSISDDGRLLAVGTLQERAAVYDISDPMLTTLITLVKDDDTGSTGDVTFKPGTNALAITESQRVVFWDLARPASPRRLSIVRFRDNAGNDTGRFSADESLFAVGANSTLTVWNTTSLRHPAFVTSLADHRGDDASKIVITTIGIGHRGSLAAVGWSNGRVEVWDVRRR